MGLFLKVDVIFDAPRLPPTPNTFSYFYISAQSDSKLL